MPFVEGEEYEFDTEREGRIQARVTDTYLIDEDELIVEDMKTGREKMVPLGEINAARRLGGDIEYDGPRLGDLEDDIGF